jgi:hypothetical protein
MLSRTVLIITVFLLFSLVLYSAGLQAFPYYSRPSTGEGWCKGCHGDFRDDAYVSRAEETEWGNLHDLHRNGMLGGVGYPVRCKTCHMFAEGRPDLPVSTFKSGGNGEMDPIGCVGCHGRYEDVQPQDDNGHDAHADHANGFETHGMGAGLRQHHWSAGMTFCVNCHDDADPTQFETAGEDAIPPYYVPDGVFLNKPTDPCNIEGGEDYAGLLFGLDNDGDGLYDAMDPDCTPASGKVTICHFPPGNPDRHRSLSIHVDSLIDHAGHGDLMGGCAD